MLATDGGADMPSPFPGLDPYLESAGPFPGLHNALATEIARVLNRTLPRGYPR
jgi:hypothetical protein